MPCLSPVAIIRVGVTISTNTVGTGNMLADASVSSVHHDVSPGGEGGGMASYEAILRRAVLLQRMEVAN